MVFSLFLSFSFILSYTLFPFPSLFPPLSSPYKPIINPSSSGTFNIAFSLFLSFSFILSYTLFPLPSLFPLSLPLFIPPLSSLYSPSLFPLQTFNKSIFIRYIQHSLFSLSFFLSFSFILSYPLFPLQTFNKPIFIRYIQHSLFSLSFDPFLGIESLHK